jgi:hypothetical protein
MAPSLPPPPTTRGIQAKASDDSLTYSLESGLLATAASRGGGGGTVSTASSPMPPQSLHVPSLHSPSQRASSLPPKPQPLPQEQQPVIEEYRELHEAEPVVAAALSPTIATSAPKFVLVAPPPSPSILSPTVRVTETLRQTLSRWNSKDMDLCHPPEVVPEPLKDNDTSQHRSPLRLPSRRRGGARSLSTRTAAVAGTQTTTTPPKSKPTLSQRVLGLDVSGHNSHDSADFHELWNDPTAAAAAATVNAHAQPKLPNREPKLPNQRHGARVSHSTRTELVANTGRTKDILVPMDTMDTVLDGPPKSTLDVEWTPPLQSTLASPVLPVATTADLQWNPPKASGDNDDESVVSLCLDQIHDTVAEQHQPTKANSKTRKVKVAESNTGSTSMSSATGDDEQDAAAMGWIEPGHRQDVDNDVSFIFSTAKSATDGGTDSDDDSGFLLFDAGPIEPPMRSVSRKLDASIAEESDDGSDHSDELYIETAPAQTATPSKPHVKKLIGQLQSAVLETMPETAQQHHRRQRAMQTAAGAVVILVEKCRVKRLHRKGRGRGDGGADPILLEL